MDNSKGYRSRLGIIRDILLVAKNAGDRGCKKTHIMYGASLSYKLLTRYLEYVLDANLLDYDGEAFYKITEKGRAFLKVYNNYEKETEAIEEHVLSMSNGKKELKKMLERNIKKEQTSEAEEE